jgi:hypothetical protein
MITDMKIGFRINNEEQDYFPRQDYREFFERVLQRNLTEKKFPFFVIFCPFQMIVKHLISVLTLYQGTQPALPVAVKLPL